MKTKLKIDIHSAENTTILENIANLVGNHNSGKTVIDLTVLEGYFKAFLARWDCYKGESKREDNILYLTVQEKPFITLEEVEIHELQTENI